MPDNVTSPKLGASSPLTIKEEELSSVNSSADIRQVYVPVVSTVFFYPGHRHGQNFSSMFLGPLGFRVANSEFFSRLLSFHLSKG